MLDCSQGWNVRGPTRPSHCTVQSAKQIVAAHLENQILAEGPISLQRNYTPWKSGKELKSWKVESVDNTGLEPSQILIVWRGRVLEETAERT